MSIDTPPPPPPPPPPRDKPVADPVDRPIVEDATSPQETANPSRQPANAGQDAVPLSTVSDTSAGQGPDAMVTLGSGGSGPDEPVVDLVNQPIVEEATAPTARQETANPSGRSANADRGTVPLSTVPDTSAGQGPDAVDTLGSGGSGPDKPVVDPFDEPIIEGDKGSSAAAAPPDLGIQQANEPANGDSSPTMTATGQVEHESGRPAEEAADPTPEYYRREGSAASGRAGAADREVDRIIAEDSTGLFGKAGWVGNYEESRDAGLEERAAAHREYAHANQTSRFNLEGESRDLFVRAQELEKAGDADGASALRDQAEAKMAAATDEADRAVDQLKEAQNYESEIEDLAKGKLLAAGCENFATVLDAVEVAGPAGVLKDVVVQGLTNMAPMLEFQGPQGLREGLAAMATNLHAELAKMAKRP
jgi:hypothetical protein